MELSDYRARIDQIDRQLVELFAQRMNTAAGIAAYKKEHGLPVRKPQQADASRLHAEQLRKCHPQPCPARNRKNPAEQIVAE